MDASLDSATPEGLAAHAAFVRALARQLLADPHAADDLAQDAWVRYLRRPPRQAASVRAWLRRVATHLSIERLRSSSRSAAREERVARAEALPPVTEELAQAEVLKSVAEAVLALDEPYRTTVLLAYWRGWDARRIASETAAPLATVRSRLQRAHARLRERLDRSHGRETWALALVNLPDGGGAALVSGTTWIAAGALVAGALIGLRWIGAGSEPRMDPVQGDVPLTARAAPADAPEAAPDAPAAGAREAVAAAAAQLVRVSGTVRDLGDDELGLPARPTAGLTLAVRAKARGSAGPLANETVTTDAAGRFAVELVLAPLEGLVVGVLAPADEHHRTLTRSVELAGNAHAAEELELVRVPHGTLRGRVVDAAGQPLAGIALAIGGRSTESATDGAFAVANASETRPLEVASPGWALLGTDGPRPLQTGGYEPMSVVLAPAAELELRVLDRAGAGIEGASVSVVLPPSELAVLAVRDAPPRDAKTDAEGRAVVGRLWAARKLRVTVRLPAESRVADAMDDGRLLVAGPRGFGRPIVIAPGERLLLEARIEVERDVAGRVVLPGGAPVPGAAVEVSDRGSGNAWSRPVLLALETDGDGRFAGRLRTAELVGPLRVTARAPALAPPPTGATAGLGYVGSRTAPDVSSIAEPAAETELDPDAVEALTALELELGPRVAITGTLLGRDGAPVRIGMGGSRVWAVPAGTTYHGLGVAARTFPGEPGRFELPGLAPGRYDVCVSEELEGWYSFENFLHRFESVEAGASGVELRLPERRETRIVVRVAGEPVADGVVLCRRLFAAPGFVAPDAERVTRVRGASGWPEGGTYGFTGIGGRALAAGRTSDGYDGFSGVERALQPVEPGWYALGLHVPGSFPQATAILRFGEGEYVVEFEPLPAAILRGEVLGEAAGEFLAVSLVDAAGVPVPLGQLEGFAEPATVLETSASGAFVLREVPTGAFTLRAGTRAELERGASRREVPLTIVPGENPPVELRL